MPFFLTKAVRLEKDRKSVCRIEVERKNTEIQSDIFIFQQFLGNTNIPLEFAGGFAKKLSKNGMKNH